MSFVELETMELDIVISTTAAIRRLSSAPASRALVLPTLDVDWDAVGIPCYCLTLPDKGGSSWSVIVQ